QEFVLNTEHHSSVRAGARIYAFGALACLIGCPPAFAQQFPTKPVRMVVPIAPGGGLDGAARAFAAKLSESLKQQVIVENRPGANSAVGTEAVVKSSPDGYTVLFTGSGAVVLGPLASSNLPYDPLRDLTPITLVSSNHYVFIVNSGLAASSIQELIALLKANPGKY